MFCFHKFLVGSLPFCHPLRGISAGALRHSIIPQRCSSDALWHSIIPQRCSSDESSMGTPLDLVQHWQRVFEANGIPEAQESSEYIVSFVLGAKTFQSLPVQMISRTVTEEQWQQVERLSTERLLRMPVQYVIGEWDFGGMTLKMRPPVFIPRPETEELVKLAVDELSREKTFPGSGQMEQQQALQTLYADVVDYGPDGFSLHLLHPIIMDIGCGSGAISLSLLQKLPQGRVVSVDKREEAVNLTRENADRLHLADRIQILHHNILSDPLDELLRYAPVDMIVSNPPYILEEDMTGLAPEILSYEDHDALYGGTDGLMVIKAILSLAAKLLKDSGSVFLEVDPRHPEMIVKWLTACPRLQLHVAAVHEDFCGKLRFLHLQKTKAPDLYN
ncbi:MTRF1L release factor glutamine methyltransferase isoform X1 [Ambystoma mexicanum]|uniref:MTRF1L release factor glutamine methyltransferase isoform X1 n=1 Tax=Ambystoma mexicanum TaxID=8296 RepID=UPI0037E95204